MERGKDQPRPSFSVSIPNPDLTYIEIWNNVLGDYRNITALMEDSARPDDCNFLLALVDLRKKAASDAAHPNSALFDIAVTWVNVETHMGPYFNIKTRLLFAEQDVETPPFGFYSKERLGTIIESLRSQGLDASLEERGTNFRWTGERHKRQKRKIIFDDVVKIKNDFGTEVLVHFGPPDVPSLRALRGEKMRESLKRMGYWKDKGNEEWYEDARYGLQRLIKNADNDKNDEIAVELYAISTRDGGLGLRGRSFRNEKTFTKNAKFYAETLQKLIIVLHEERGTILPTGELSLKYIDIPQDELL